MYYIIMGIRGAKEVFLGRNSVKIINSISYRPIIVVPTAYIIKVPLKIVFSTNLIRSFHKKELAPLINLVRMCDARLTIAQLMREDNLNDLKRRNKESLKTLFKGLDYLFYKVDVDTSETHAIKDFISESESDIIALVNHQYNFFQRLMEEDVVKKISFNSSVPILILPELV